MFETIFAVLNGPTAPPMHDFRHLAEVMGVTFLACLLNYIHPSAPLLKWVGRHQRRIVTGVFGDDAVDCSWLRSVWLIFEPMFRQRSFLTATLISGLFGIVLWNYGYDGLDRVWAISVSAAFLYVLAGMAALKWTVGNVVRYIWPAVSLPIYLYFAQRAASWAL